MNDAITSASRALAECARVRAEVAHSKATLSCLNERVRRLKRRLREEERRCHRFERATPVRLIHGVLGTLEARRKEQRDEWLRIREALLHAMAQRDAKVEEIKQLQLRLSYLEKAPEFLDAALERKSIWLRIHDREAGARLCELEAGERELLEILRKIERAVADSRRRAVRTLRPALTHRLVLLQEMYAHTQRRLEDLWRERHALLCDGARLMRLAPASAGLH